VEEEEEEEEEEMKEAQIAKDLVVTIKDVEIPQPGPKQIVIRVVVSGSNPKDWYVFYSHLSSGFLDAIIVIHTLSSKDV
jgi:NADPH:quinone reductase-like Zn-dependent oxidoreductase